MDMDIAELFNLQHDVLFGEAQAIKERLRIIRATPFPIIGTCKTRPTCRHCSWENLKKVNPTFHKKRTRDEILQRTTVLIEAGIDRTFLSSGWMGYEAPNFFYEYVSAVKQNSTMEVYGLFGAISKKSLKGLREAGMDGYFCGIESPNEQVYRKFRPGGDSLADRKKAIQDAQEIGLKIWSGFILGVGETQTDIISGLKFFADIGVDSVSILPLFPTPYTEMWDVNPVNPLYWARTIAISRIYLNAVNIFVTMNPYYGEYGRITGANGIYIQVPDKM